VPDGDPGDRRAHEAVCRAFIELKDEPGKKFIEFAVAQPVTNKNMMCWKVEACCHLFRSPLCPMCLF